MQKFYKLFTMTTLALFAIWCGSAVFSKNTDGTVSAQSKQIETCAAQNVFVIEDSSSRTVHLIYDFSRSTVSLVQLQKGYTPDISVKTKPLAQ